MRYLLERADAVTRRGPVLYTNLLALPFMYLLYAMSNEVVDTEKCAHARAKPAAALALGGGPPAMCSAEVGCSDEAGSTGTARLGVLRRNSYFLHGLVVSQPGRRCAHRLRLVDRARVGVTCTVQVSATLYTVIGVVNKVPRCAQPWWVLCWLTRVVPA